MELMIKHVPIGAWKYNFLTGRPTHRRPTDQPTYDGKFNFQWINGLRAKKNTQELQEAIGAKRANCQNGQTHERTGEQSNRKRSFRT